MTVLRVCFLGDSLVAGTGDREHLGWPGRLCAAEAAKGHDLTLYNLGVRADTSLLLARRWMQECQARLPAGVAAGLVFAFGVNDTAQEPDGRLRVVPEASLALAREILTAAKAWLPTLLIGPLPVEESMMPLVVPGLSVRDMRNDRIVACNRAYAALCAELELPFVDLYSQLIGDAAWFDSLKAGDGIHPTAAGYALLARAIGASAPWRRWIDG
jgi:acyl-CoA thioesterase I